MDAIRARAEAAKARMAASLRNVVRIQSGHFFLEFGRLGNWELGADMPIFVVFRFMFQ